MDDLLIVEVLEAEGALEKDATQLVLVYAELGCGVEFE